MMSAVYRTDLEFSGDDEVVSVGYFSVVRPDQQAIAARVEAYGFALRSLAIDVDSLELGDGAGKIEEALEAAQLRRSGPPPIVGDPVQGLRNEVERALRGQDRKLAAQDVKLDQILAALTNGIPRGPVEDVPKPATIRYRDQDAGPEVDAARPMPTHRRDRPGATPEMLSGKMELLGPSSASQIFVVGTNGNGEIDAVPGKLPTVGDSLKTGRR